MKNKSIEVKAKTVYEAIADACQQLGVAQDEVNVEILSQGGMFGKAKVLVTVKEDVAKPEPKQEPKPEPKAEAKREKPVAVAIPLTSNKKTNSDAHLRATESPDLSENVAAKRQGRVCDLRTPCLAQVQESPQTYKGDVTSASGIKFEKTLAFVKTLLELLENDSTVTTELTEKSFNINVNGENVGRLIGKGGEVLNAIQTIVSSIAISNSNGEGKRVFINIGDYKERRGDSLQTLALKKAEYVKSSGKFVKLDPMNSRDRAIIHTVLSEVEGIRTYSTGKDPFRCLCIAPADKKDKDPASREPCSASLRKTEKKDA